MPIFQCEQCLKAFDAEANLHVKVYEGQALCLMCRKASGQNKFTPEEEICLFSEENISKNLNIGQRR